MTVAFPLLFLCSFAIRLRIDWKTKAINYSKKKRKSVKQWQILSLFYFLSWSVCTENWQIHTTVFASGNKSVYDLKNNLILCNHQWRNHGRRGCYSLFSRVVWSSWSFLPPLPLAWKTEDRAWCRPDPIFFPPQLILHAPSWEQEPRGGPGSPPLKLGGAQTIFGSPTFQLAFST